MPNRNYVNGRSFEYRVRDLFEAKGYFVMRSAGSRTPVDLVALKDGEILLIQCKRHGVIGSEDINILRAVSLQCSGKALLAEIPKGKTRGVEINEVTGKMAKSGKRPVRPWKGLE